MAKLVLMAALPLMSTGEPIESNVTSILEGLEIRIPLRGLKQS
jgi:hypothetical protein